MADSLNENTKVAQRRQVRGAEAKAADHSATRMVKSHHAPRGHTLVELTVVMLVIALLASIGVPRFVHSLEQSKVDMAASNLRAIWTAQRLYWLAHQTYAPDLVSLYTDPVDGENFLAMPDAVDPTQPYYVCALTPGSATATDFQATATRSPATAWTGSLTIGSNGVVTGSITGPDGAIYNPTPNFQ